MKSIIPSARDIARETLIVLAGALLATVIINSAPKLKQWLKDKGAIP